VKTDTFFVAFNNRLEKAETRYLQAKAKFLEDAVANPADAVACGGYVIERQEYFNTLKVVEGYLDDEGYATRRAALVAALGFFNDLLARAATAGRSTCDISNGVERRRLLGIRETVSDLNYLLGHESLDV
jgi:hypothetical protein